MFFRAHPFSPTHAQLGKMNPSSAYPANPANPARNTAKATDYLAKMHPPAPPPAATAQENAVQAAALGIYT